MPDPVPHCPVHPDVPLALRRRGWWCPVCTRRILSFSQWPRPLPPASQPQVTDPALARLPWLVATPLAGARDASRPDEERQDHARAAAFATVRLAALLLMAEARTAGDSDAELAAPLAHLALPGWRPWIDLAQRLALGARTRSTRFGHLLAGWALLSATGGLDLLRAMMPAAGGNQSPRREIELPTVERIACTLFGGDGPTLLRAVDPDWGQAIPLHGPVVDRVWRVGPGLDPTCVPEGCRVVASGEGGVLPLEPLLIPGELVPRGDGTFTGEPALGLLVATADGGLFQGLGAPVRRHQLWGVREARQAVERGGEGVRISRQDAAPVAAAETRRRISAIRERPWHAGPLLPRPAVEERLTAALRRPGRGIVVAGEAGVGKTVMLARLAAHLLGVVADDEHSSSFASLAASPADDPDVVALVSGPGVWARTGSETGRRTLCRVVARALGARGCEAGGLEELWGGLGTSAVADRRLGRKVWLLLDGLDEDEHGAELLCALDTALPELATYPWLRLVVSLDVTTCRQMAARGEGPAAWFESSRFLEVFLDPGTAEHRPWLELPPLSPADEAPAFFAARQRSDPARACPLPYSLLPPATCAVLGNPMRLQVFHESHRWLGAPPGELGLHALMAGLGIGQGEAAGHPVTELAARLWVARAPGLTLEDLWGWVESWLDGLAGPSLHAARCGPVEALLEWGLLVPPEPDPGWPPPPDARARPPHPLVTESLLWLAAPGRAHGHREPHSAALAACLALPPGRWSLRHELAGVLRGLAARAAEAGDLAALDPLLRAGDPEVAAVALSGVVSAAAEGRVELGSWLEVTAVDGETCLRLLRACTVAGLAEATAEPVAAFRYRLLAGAAGHFPLDAGLRRRLAAARLAVAARALGPSDALRLLREARSDLDAVCARWPATPDLLVLLADALVHLGGAAATLGHADEAEAALRRGVPLVRMRLAAEPASAEPRRRLASALVTLAGLAVAADRHVEAERLLGEATGLVSTLRAAEPERADHRRLWGRLLHASGVAARARHRLQRAWNLLEEAVATLGALAGAPGLESLQLEYVRAAVDFAELAAEERATQAARAALEEGLRALGSGQPGGRDPAVTAAEAELTVSLASLARDRSEERELCRRARDLLEPLARGEGAPPRVPALWRRVCPRLGELEAVEAKGTHSGDEVGPHGTPGGG
ncbi:MAG: hypothetical protein AB2L07_17610 [Thermoanaerobaculaceae bacterium]